MHGACVTLSPYLFIHSSVCLFVSTGGLCGHPAAQPPGVPGATAHPHPVAVHGRPGALYHPVPRLLPQRSRRHTRPQRSRAGGRCRHTARWPHRGSSVDTPSPDLLVTVPFEPRILEHAILAFQCPSEWPDCLVQALGPYWSRDTHSFHPW